MTVDSSLSSGDVVPLPMTGERTAPDTDQENYWFRRHECGYQWALDVCRGAMVVEAGSGEGYGAAMLASVATHVWGLDYDVVACQHSRTKYSHRPASSGRVSFTQADLGAFPLADSCADVVVNSQVIEHLPAQDRFMEECWRVLRPGGTLVVATPNRITFTPEGQPINPFHVRELSAVELAELFVNAGFRLASCWGVYHGPRLRLLDTQWGGFIDAQLQLYLDNRPWPEELRRDVDSVVAADFELRSVDPDVLWPGSTTATPAPLGDVPPTTSLDDSLDLFFMGRKP